VNIWSVYLSGSGCSRSRAESKPVCWKHEVLFWTRRPARKRNRTWYWWKYSYDWREWCGNA